MPAASFEARLSSGGRSSLQRIAAALLARAFSRRKVAVWNPLCSAESAPGACWAGDCEASALHSEERLQSSLVATSRVSPLPSRSGDTRRSAANRLRWSNHGSFRAFDTSSARVVQSFLWILGSILPQVPARAQFSRHARAASFQKLLSGFCLGGRRDS